MKNLFSKNSILLIFAVVFCSGIIFSKLNILSDWSAKEPIQKGDFVEITINEAVFVAQKADTPSERERGLSGKEDLMAQEGMWFDFGYENQWGIWMKDMKFPIDIVWFDKNLRIVFIAEHISPKTFPKVFMPEQAALYVLEVQAGTVEKFGFGTGDEAKID